MLLEWLTRAKRERKAGVYFELRLIGRSRMRMAFVDEHVL